MLLYWYSSKYHGPDKKKHRTEKTILSLNVFRHFLHLLLLWNYVIIIIVVEFTGYGGFAVVNTTVVEINIPVLFKIELYSNPLLNVLFF